MRKLLLAGLLALVLWTPSVAAANPDGTGEGVIKGVVMSSTADAGGPIAAQTVTLTPYRGTEPLDAVATTSDEQGGFEFGGLAMEAEYSYLVSLEYETARYESDLINFANGEPTQLVTMIVYETTSDDSAISVHAAHVIIMPQEDYIAVSEYYLLFNGADRTYTGSEGKTLRFLLPPGATNLSYDFGLTESSVRATDGGFSDTMAFIPGAKEMGFSYVVPVTGSSVSLKTAAVYPTDSYEVLLAGDIGQVKSDQLTTMESLNIQGMNYGHLSGKSFSAGTPLEIQISGLAAKPESSLSWLWAMLGSVVLLGGLTFGYLMRRRPRPAPVAASGSYPATAERQELLLKLARLDDDFEAGRIPEAEYKKLRVDTKARLQGLRLDHKEEGK